MYFNLSPSFVNIWSYLKELQSGFKRKQNLPPESKYQLFNCLSQKALFGQVQNRNGKNAWFSRQTRVVVQTHHPLPLSGYWYRTNVAFWHLAAPWAHQAEQSVAEHHPLCSPWRSNLGHTKTCVSFYYWLQEQIVTSTFIESENTIQTVLVCDCVLETC